MMQQLQLSEDTVRIISSLWPASHWRGIWFFYVLFYRLLQIGIESFLSEFILTFAGFLGNISQELEGFLPEAEGLRHPRFSPSALAGWTGAVHSVSGLIVRNR